jgi:glyoxylase I family protein
MDVPGLPIVGLDHVVLRVRALEPMLRFYRDVLGCTLVRHVESIGLWQLRAGASMIDLVPVDGELGRAGGAAPGAQGHNLDHFCLQLATFDEPALRTALGAHGIVAGKVVRRVGALGEGPSIYLQDPDGNTVELKGPPAEPG